MTRFVMSFSLSNTHQPHKEIDSLLYHSWLVNPTHSGYIQIKMHL